MKRLVRFFAVIISSLHLCFALLSTNVFALKDTKPLRILAYGDSLTAGYRLPPADSYPAQLEARLKQDGYHVEIVNGGVSGDTSAQALARLDWSLKKGPFDYVLLCVGANDGLRQLAVAPFAENLKKLIRAFQAKNIKVILIGMQLPTNFAPDYRQAFAKVYTVASQEFKVPLYPFFLEGVTQNTELNLDDTIHPNKEGYAIVAKNLQAFLKRIIKRSAQ